MVWVRGNTVNGRTQGLFGAGPDSLQRERFRVPRGCNGGC